MGKVTGIAWTSTKLADGALLAGSTFNPWIGCAHVSAGCDFCYAEVWDNRNLHSTESHWGIGASRKIMSEHYWNEPLRWNRKAIKSGINQKVFCASLADVFDLEAPQGARDRLWKLIKQTTNLTWLLLTKRPENAPDMFPSDWGDGYDNVWFGTTTENQQAANHRIPLLQKVKAKIKFLSVEPQIGKIDFSEWLTRPCELHSHNCTCGGIDEKSEWKAPFDWLIFGGESGSEEARDKAGNITRKATCRPFDPNWMKEPMEQAAKAGVAVFVKQMGTIFAKENNYHDKKGGDPTEWEPWAQVQEFPEAIKTAV